MNNYNNNYSRQLIDIQAEAEAKALHSQGKASNNNYRRIRLQSKTYSEQELNKIFVKGN